MTNREHEIIFARAAWEGSAYTRTVWSIGIFFLVVILGIGAFIFYGTRNSAIEIENNTLS